MNCEEPRVLYKVVLNHEAQYSIWPARRDNPCGWLDAGRSGTLEDCLAWIEGAWVDMRPLSLRGDEPSAVAAPRVQGPASRVEDTR